MNNIREETIEEKKRKKLKRTLSRYDNIGQNLDKENTNKKIKNFETNETSKPKKSTKKTKKRTLSSISKKSVLQSTQKTQTLEKTPKKKIKTCSKKSVKKSIQKQKSRNTIPSPKEKKNSLIKRKSSKFIKSKDVQMKKKSSKDPILKKSFNYSNMSHKISPKMIQKKKKESRLSFLDNYNSNPKSNLVHKKYSLFCSPEIKKEYITANLKNNFSQSKFV